MRRFDDQRLYEPGELSIIAARNVLSEWRIRGEGPAYVKVGRNVLYRGADLNAWAEARRPKRGRSHLGPVH